MLISHLFRALLFSLRVGEIGSVKGSGSGLEAGLWGGAGCSLLSLAPALFIWACHLRLDGGGEGEDSFLHIPQQLPLCLAGTNKPPATNKQDLFSILLEIRGEDLGLSYSLWPPGHPLSPASVPHPPNPRSHT